MNKGIGRRSWWIVAASAVATIGTSAPEGGLILDEEERSALPSDEVVQFDVIASRKAVQEAHNFEVLVVVSLPAGAEEGATVRLIPDDSEFAIVAGSVSSVDGDDAQMQATVSADFLEACPEDNTARWLGRPCTVGFSVDLSPAQSYDVRIKAKMTRPELSGACASDGGPFSSDATLAVVIL